MNFQDTTLGERSWSNNVDSTYVGNLETDFVESSHSHPHFPQSTKCPGCAWSRSCLRKHPPPSTHCAEHRLQRGGRWSPEGRVLGGVTRLGEGRTGAQQGVGARGAVGEGLPSAPVMGTPHTFQALLTLLRAVLLSGWLTAPTSHTQAG